MDEPGPQLRARGDVFGSAKLNLCRNLCDRHNCIGEFQEIALTDVAKELLQEVHAIIACRTKNGLPSDDHDVMSRWRNSLVDANEPSNVSAPCFAQDFLGNKVYMQCAIVCQADMSSHDFLAGGDICIETENGREKPRLLGFVESANYPGRRAIARWWIEPISVTHKEHRVAIQVSTTTIQIDI
jgi:hypothetical protein